MPSSRRGPRGLSRGGRSQPLPFFSSTPTEQASSLFPGVFTASPARSWCLTASNCRAPTCLCPRTASAVRCVFQRGSFFSFLTRLSTTPHNHSPSPAGDYPIDGTTLMPLGGRGNASAAPFITLQHNGAVRGLVIYHPEQLPDRVPVPYPFAIALVVRQSSRHVPCVVPPRPLCCHVSRPHTLPGRATTLP